MSIQESRRSAFELACQRDYPGCYIGRMKSGQYINHTIDSGWWAWNAALDSVVVVLPENVDGGQYQLALEDCIEAITAAGIPVEVAK